MRYEEAMGCNADLFNLQLQQNRLHSHTKVPPFSSICLAAAYAAGIAAEGLRYEEVMGQNADLFDLQRILLRSKTKLSNQQQQNITRWAVWRAASILKKYSAEHKVGLLSSVVCSVHA